MRGLSRISQTAWALAIALSSGAVLAQQGLMIYPAKGQSPDQQSKDQYECNQWAIQQSGYDPSQPPAKGKSGAGKEMLRGGARGAAAGAAIGAIAGDAGKGAAIGATAGGLSRGMKTRDQSRNVPPPGQADYQKAMAACLEGRGYSVK